MIKKQNKLSVRVLTGCLSGLLLLALESGSAWAQPSPVQGYVTEKAVLLMRHGVVSIEGSGQIDPENGRVIRGFAREDARLSNLGRDALTYWGEYWRTTLSLQGLIPWSGALGPDNITVYSSHFTRNLDSVDAFLGGFAPGHNVAPLHAGIEHWFAPRMDGLAHADPIAVGRAVEQGLGMPLAQAQAHYRPAMEALERHLSITVGTLSQLPWEVIFDGRGLRMAPLQGLDQLAETMRMRFADNLTTQGVAPIADQAALNELMLLRRVHLDAVLHPRFLAIRHGVQLIDRITESLLGNDGPDNAPVVLYAGHAVNIGAIRSVLGFDWAFPEHGANDVAPGGTLMFERLRRLSDNERFVRISYHTPTIDQIRHRWHFDEVFPPLSATFQPPRAFAEGHTTMMPEARFRALLAGLLMGTTPDPLPTPDTAAAGTTEERVNPVTTRVLTALPPMLTDRRHTDGRQHTPRNMPSIHPLIHPPADPQPGRWTIDSMLNPFSR